jgi:uncharacterized membrane protein YtjA (UPF0391 family)
LIFSVVLTRTNSRLSPGLRNRAYEGQMLYWALVFFIIAVVAGVLGFGGISAAAGGIAQILFYIFVVIFLVALIAGLLGGRRAGPPPL